MKKWIHRFMLRNKSKQKQPIIQEDLVQEKMVEVVPTNPTIKRVLTVDSMFCAGPRKIVDDSVIDYGEDIAGYMQFGDDLILWILDGTSHTSCLRRVNGSIYFSSRLLAQAISLHLAELAEHYISNYLDFSLPIIFKEAMERSVNYFKTNIDNLDPLTMEGLHSKINRENNAFSSTTLAMAYLNTTGTAEVFQIGDSNILIHTQNNSNNLLFAKDGVAKYGRINLLVTHDEDGQLIIKYPSDAFEYACEKYSNVSTLLLYTDGLGQKSEYFLQSFNGIEQKEFRLKLSQLFQNPDDDRLLMIAQIKTILNSSNPPTSHDESKD